jgi:hypothetical protein
LSSPLHTRTLRMERHYYLFTDKFLVAHCVNGWLA